MGNVCKAIILICIFMTTRLYANQCKAVFCPAGSCNSQKLKGATKGVLFFSTATGLIWGGLELSKELEQNQVIFASIVAGAVVFSLFNTVITPVLLPLQNKVQRMSFRMLHNSEPPTTVKHKRLHDFWRDNNTHFGPNESMGRNHYAAVLGKAFHRMTFAHEQIEKGNYEYALDVFEKLLMELRYYPEIFPKDLELKQFMQSHIIYLDPEIRQQARIAMESMAKQKPEFEEAYLWAIDYLEL